MKPTALMTGPAVAKALSRLEAAARAWERDPSEHAAVEVCGALWAADDATIARVARAYFLRPSILPDQIALAVWHALGGVERRHTGT